MLKICAKYIINLLGFEIFRIYKPNNNSYEEVKPWATYSPWNNDRAFVSVFEKINKNTLIDKYRCFELWSLIKQSSKLSSGSIIEIGVWRGGSGALMAQQAKNCGISAPIYLCDTFKGMVKSGKNDSFIKDNVLSDTSIKIVEDLLLNNLKLNNVRILEGVFPDESSHRVENETFRFCHIDVDVYESAKDITDWIWDKIVPGGIIVYDDYGFDGTDGITKYVEEQMLYTDRLILHNLNGHAVIIKL
jgi:O-methyltransferase